LESAKETTMKERRVGTTVKVGTKESAEKKKRGAFSEGKAQQ